MLFEVLSKTTEAWDRGEKFSHYQLIPSLQHYVLIRQDFPRVEHFRRQDGQRWSYRAYGAVEILVLDGVRGELAIAMDALYADLPEPTEDAPPRGPQ